MVSKVGINLSQTINELGGKTPCHKVYRLRNGNIKVAVFIEDGIIVQIFTTYKHYSDWRKTLIQK